MESVLRIKLVVIVHVLSYLFIVPNQTKAFFSRGIYIIGVICCHISPLCTNRVVTSVSQCRNQNYLKINCKFDYLSYTFINVLSRLRQPVAIYNLTIKNPSTVYAVLASNSTSFKLWTQQQTLNKGK